MYGLYLEIEKMHKHLIQHGQRLKTLIALLARMYSGKQIYLTFEMELYPSWAIFGGLLLRLL